jgi:flagellin
MWRSTNGATWSQVNTNGFGDVNNQSIFGLVDFKGYFYVTTGNEISGGELWRCSDASGCDQPSDWAQVGGNGLGDPDNRDVEPNVELGGYLYIGTSNDTTGCEVWRSSNGTNWSQVNTDGFGDAANTSGLDMIVSGGYLYLGVWNSDTGGELWRCAASSGCNQPADWSQTGGDGFGDADNLGLWPLAEFNGYLYVGVYNEVDGARVYRSNNGTTWTPVSAHGFGDVNNTLVFQAVVFNNKLYLGAGNWTSGVEIWQTNNGTAWEKVSPDGLGDSNNLTAYLAVFNNSLYLAAENWASGAEVWQMNSGQVYLPVVLKFP